LNEHKTFPQVETERLLLRPWRDSDREPWPAMNADPRVREFFPGLLTRDRSDASIDLFMECFARDGFCFWAVEEKASARFAGFTGLHRVDFDAIFTPCVEIGWRLTHRFWGRGLSSEAARASLDYGFGRLGLSEIVAFTPMGNVGSRKVMERIGMSRDQGGTFIHPKMPPDHSLQPSVLYRITRHGHARAKQINSAEEACS
jgi:RimJ/RimL family protein N-acetyltransferase